jgi:hypothetical protein
MMKYLLVVKLVDRLVDELVVDDVEWNGDVGLPYGVTLFVWVVDDKHRCISEVGEMLLIVVWVEVYAVFVVVERKMTLKERA